LLYSGVTMKGHYTHSGGPSQSSCIALDSTPVGSPSGSQFGALLYVGSTETTGFGSAIPDNRVIKCGVLYSDTPVVQIWGKATGPTGWTKVYSGFAMGSYHNQASGDLICVDSENFDATIVSPYQGALYYPAEYQVSPSNGGLNPALQEHHVACSVYKKNDPSMLS
jgi:hypothetical protein